MRAFCTFAAALLFCGFALLLWRSLFDLEGLPPRLMAGMTARPLPGPSLPGRVPYGAGNPAAPGGASLFAVHCAHCHGADGSGQGYVSTRPGMPDVPDLRHNPAPAAQTRQSLAGGRGAMPAFGQRLPAAWLDSLHQHILDIQTPPTP